MLAKGDEPDPSNDGPPDRTSDNDRRFRLMVQGVTDCAIFMLNPDGMVLSWNAGAERIQGYRADDIVGQHFGLFFTPEDRAAGAPATALDTARRDGRLEAEGWRLRQDGTRFFAAVAIEAIRDEGTLIGFATTIRDISQRQAMLDALRNSERHFRLLVSGVTDYALYMLDTEGHVTSWNAGGTRIKGYAPDEIIGQHFSRFYTAADQAAGRPARALSIVRSTGRYEEEGWRVRRDGSFFWASVVMDAIHDEDGTLIGFAKITRDITERRKAQTDLEKVQKQLAESQKMDALGQLTGGVAHDFNNLLMVVSGHIHALKRAAAHDPRAARAAHAIELAAQRGAALTRQLLTFSRRQSVNPESIPIGKRIESIRDVLGSGLGGQVRLALDIPADAWPVMVDPNEFEIALVNLVINARDAMPDGGTVTITSRNETLAAEGAIAAGDYLAISVEDTGVGIPGDVIAKVFEPFFTTKPPGRGTGLGLSQVHGFAHQAGGTVSVSSVLGRGTLFTIHLPRSGASAAHMPDAADDTGQRDGKVLLVEDNPEVASASAGLLEQLGYRVRWASDAETALKVLAEGGIDLIFSDLVMPGRMDGLALARLIRQAHPNLPILLTTGYSEAASTARTDFLILPKPYQMHELSQALTELGCRPAESRQF